AFARPPARRRTTAPARAAPAPTTAAPACTRPRSAPRQRPGPAPAARGSSSASWAAQPHRQAAEAIERFEDVQPAGDDVGAAIAVEIADGDGTQADRAVGNLPGAEVLLAVVFE